MPRQRHAAAEGHTKEKYVSTSSASVAWLTQESYDRLKAELDYLSGPGRTEIVARIEQARSEGDLKENGGYHAAKEEQGKAEARIRQLTELLRNAHVGEAPADDGVVEPGMVVEAKIAGDAETFLLGSREVAGDASIDVYSEKSPLGAAINGKKAGETVAYTAPNGKEIKVEIISAKPYAG
jgi:transcription elongation factor GreA